ncbi:MAG: tetratricopeptide repeat protein [Parvibaculum sp.]|nr:tetratricopeptide repeat protein [Parvibaculum sp.]|tara:strand:- start:1759 stop:2529 length:771 start_codon:yes stop_codon:yes gene_type:complete
MFAYDAMRRLGVILTICAVSVSATIINDRATAAPATVQSNLGTPLPPPSERFREGVAAYDRGDFTNAYAIWLPLAQQSDLAAMRNVALLLREGKGTTRDSVRALWFYEEAGAKGFALAQVNAAFMHLEGDGVPKNLEAAAFWFHAGALAGSPIAQYNLAVMYERGSGVEKDMPKALGWYALAARSGSKPALDRLALLVPAIEGPKAPERAPLPDAAATSQAEQDSAAAPTTPPSDAPIEEPQTDAHSLDMDDPARL